MMDGIAPPPRRSMPSKPSSSSQAPPTLWEKTKTSSAGTFDWLYTKTEQAGWWVNEQAAKTGVEAFNPAPFDQDCDKCARILRMFTLDGADTWAEEEQHRKKVQKVIKKIPKEVIQQAKGLCIYTVLRTGLVLTGTSGSGMVIARLPDGSWSCPSGLLTMNMGVGLAAGVDVSDVVLILNTEAAVEAFTSPRLTLGAELAISAGPYGGGGLLESGINRTPVFAYTKSKGLYGGLQVEGNIMIERTDDNARQYGLRISAQELLSGEWNRMPACANGLIQTILAAEGQPFDRSALPAEKAPSQVDAELPHGRKLPPQDFDEEDLREREELARRLHEIGIDDPCINDKLREGDPLVVRSPALPDEEATPVDDSDAPLAKPVVLNAGPPPPLPPRRSFGGTESPKDSAPVSRSGSIKPAIPPRRRPVEQGSPQPERTSLDQASEDA